MQAWCKLLLLLLLLLLLMLTVLLLLGTGAAKQSGRLLLTDLTGMSQPLLKHNKTFSTLPHQQLQLC